MLAVILIGLYFVLRDDARSTVAQSTQTTSAQTIDIRAKGGYAPRVINAQAGKPATLRVTTQGTYDCSSALPIPALGIQKTLPASGITEIAIPSQKSGTNLLGMCSMGMYQFQIRFL